MKRSDTTSAVTKVEWKSAFRMCITFHLNCSSPAALKVTAYSCCIQMVSPGDFEKFGFKLSFLVHVGSYFQLIAGKIRIMKIMCAEKSRKLCKLTEIQTVIE